MKLPRVKRRDSQPTTAPDTEMDTSLTPVRKLP
jgi:hypothetical protein